MKSFFKSEDETIVEPVAAQPNKTEQSELVREAHDIIAFIFGKNKSSQKQDNIKII